MNVLVVSQSTANLDPEILDRVCDPNNPLKLGRRKAPDEATENDYYIFSTNAECVAGLHTLSVQRFNNMVQQARARNFNFIMLTL